VSSQKQLCRCSANNAAGAAGGWGGPRFFVAALLAFLLWGLGAVPTLADNGYDRRNSKGNQLIVRVKSGDLSDIAAKYGVEVVGRIGAGRDVALIEGPESMTAEQLADLLRDDSRIHGIGKARLTALPSTEQINLAVEEVASDLSKPGDFTTPCLGAGFGRLLWSGYGDQYATHQISLHEAHLYGSDCGASAVVATLDTGVDPDHPLLAGVLVHGYDFLLEQSGVPSEWGSLDTSVTAIVEEQMKAAVNTSVTAIVEGHGRVALTGASFGPVLATSVTAIVEEQPTPSFFGHGTMVAGLVRLAAPGARIMPLRVFDGSGTAHLFDIIRAVYYAVDNGADVINMSFSLSDLSPELLRAVQYARSKGVLCVAAAGNQGQLGLVYPAAFGSTMAVTSVTAEDQLSDFANYGNGLVDLAAPGHGVISIYPGGAFGAGWGTSFSAPLVSGVAALLLENFPETRGTDDVAALINALRQGAEPLQDASSEAGGRLDALGALLASE